VDTVAEKCQISVLTVPGAAATITPMPDDWTVLDHLQQGRDQLQREVEALRQEIERLDDAIAGLDAVIGQVGGEHSSGATRQATAPLRSGRGATRSASVRDGAAPKSIRVHVLEMLGAQDRDFSLAEIIDNIHAAGIQAHDDAVRSITIKLMKVGRVERVGRGQYRLARRGNRSSVTVPDTPAELGPETDADPTVDSDVDTELGAEAELPAAEQVADEPQPEDGRQDGYTPPLNLGQPWE
jgi:cell division septum initiation protein DivIVA